MNIFISLTLFYTFIMSSRVNTSFICVLCREILEDAMQTICGCRMCKICAYDYLDAMSSPVKCPNAKLTCKQIAFEGPYKLQPDTAIRRDIFIFKQNNDLRNKDGIHISGLPHVTDYGTIKRVIEPVEDGTFKVSFISKISHQSSQTVYSRILPHMKETLNHITNELADFRVLISIGMKRYTHVERKWSQCGFKRLHFNFKECSYKWCSEHFVSMFRKKPIIPSKVNFPEIHRVFENRINSHRARKWIIEGIHYWELMFVNNIATSSKT